MSLFQPDRYFSSLACVDVKHDLLAAGLTHVLLDVDNTVRSRVDDEVPVPVLMWLARAKEAGVSFCLLSNNWHANVHAFADALGMPIVAKACKPLPFAYGVAMGRVGGTREDTVAIGDQLTTDVVGAHLAGIPAWLVMPLCDVDVKVTTFMRSFERALIGARQPERRPEGAAVTLEEGFRS